MISTLSKRLIPLLLLWIFAILQAESDRFCGEKTVCSDCIRAGCSWCSKPMNPNATEIVRCIDKSLRTSDWCPGGAYENYLVDLKNEIEIVKDAELTTGVDGGDAVQIKPQLIKLKLNLGEKIDIPLSYQQAKDYPIDLYFLMDLSSSMADDKDSLSKLGLKLSEMMNKMTNNFRLGFGSFVDKLTLPYASIVPAKLKSPCNPGVPCEPTYGFRNRMPLTSDSALFSKKVDETPVSGNLDAPEGGFDALMQVIVCKEEIRWRENARKLVIFATDAGFHMAGDGRLGGIVEPNDELCHLDANGLYTHSLIKDYPSVAQINKQARENNVNIIFASASKGQIYSSLAKSIQGALSGVLEKDSSNIVNLVETEYKKILNSVALTDDADDHIRVEYFTACTGSKLKQTSKCDSLRNRERVDFNVTLTALDCPADASARTTRIHIRPGSLGERLTVELEVNCECPCDKEGHVAPKSASCAGNGNLTCGVCVCERGWHGGACECSGVEAAASASDSSAERNSSCRRDEQSPMCSGAGACKCGKCECLKRNNPEEAVYGQYCECDNFSCQRYGGLICSGPERGRCDCGKCACRPGWSGDACECQATNVTCIDPDRGGDAVCSGHGVCKCGACRCDTTERFRYSGRYCEECPHCSSNRCERLRHCVECVVHGTGKYSKLECEQFCDASSIEVLDEIKGTRREDDDAEDHDDVPTEKICRVYDDTGCTVLFKYKYNDDNDDDAAASVSIQAQKIKECAEEIDLMAVIIGVVGAIVIGGLVLLAVWKIMTTVHDTREYTRFVREKEQAKFDRGDNPLYRPSTTSFKNPMYTN